MEDHLVRRWDRDGGTNLGSSRTNPFRAQPPGEDTPRDRSAEVLANGERLHLDAIIALDVEYKATGLDKPARAIKGTLNLNDLFGETKMKLGWTVEQSIKPGSTRVEKGSGFKYNQFLDQHHWVLATDLSNMRATFTVNSILYEDGTRRDFE